jgi:hypothetical protein
MCMECFVRRPKETTLVRLLEGIQDLSNNNDGTKAAESLLRDL